MICSKSTKHKPTRKAISFVLRAVPELASVSLPFRLTTPSSMATTAAIKVKTIIKAKLLLNIPTNVNHVACYGYTCF
jgi:hypothetical protein